MLVSMTLNPAIDKMVEIGEFRYGEMNRISRSESQIAGKGYHVAQAYQILGGSSFCLGFSFRNNRSMTEKYFLQNSLPSEFIEVQGELRVNMKVRDNSTGKITEINDKGYGIEEKDLASLFGLLRKYVTEADFFVFTGSLPPGVSEEVYRDMILEASRHGKRSVLDAEGIPLIRGIEASPYMVKVNRYEIERTFGTRISGFEEACAVCREINRMGVQIACVTLGEKGAVISDGTVFYAAKPPENMGEIINTVGAGDAFIGGMCRECSAGGSVAQMLESGIAAASARITGTGTPFLSLSAYESLRGRIRAEKL